jgi:hypothetical protein
MPNDAEHAPRGSPKKSKAHAVPSGEINGAISGLDSIVYPTNRMDNAVCMPPIKARGGAGKKRPSPRGAQLSARSDYSYSGSQRPVGDDSTAASQYSYSPQPPSGTNNSYAPSSSRSVASSGSTATHSAPVAHAHVFGTANIKTANAELYELSDENTAAMLQEIQLKEETGYQGHSYVNMHQRLAAEVCLLCCAIMYCAMMYCAVL